jgi:hypothetical protein
MPALLFLALLVVSSAQASSLSFNRDIRPILSENCFACHGFDASKRKAKLRLDNAEGALAANAEGRRAIVPGKPLQSQAYLRLISEDKDELMPPPESHKKLSAAQIEVLRQWIEQGAAYEKHWAFEPLRAATKPLDIDAMLAAELAPRGLTLAAEAPREVLIRRVAFTLTGLPPTAQELEAYLNDLSPQAYERMLERYLSSAHYGEEMARHWLDVARYADTHGLHLDNERHMWAYRDWVVQAFNQNLPYDQFTLWQIAGDLIEKPTPQSITATGFSRCNVTTSEGGAIDDEYRHLYAVDRASTLATAWMGLSAGCAQCHDHKYDPLSTREFYSLYAFFFSSADPPMDKNISTTEPYQLLPTAAQQQRVHSAQQQLGKAEARLSELVAKLRDPGPLPKPAAAPKPGAKAVAAKPAANKAATAAIPAGPDAALDLLVFDDDFPLGCEVRNTSRNASRWLDNAALTHRGKRALHQEGGRFFEHQLSFTLTPFKVPAQGHLRIWVRPDPQSPPQAIALIAAGKRSFWGSGAALDPNAEVPPAANGPLPKPGQWSLLDVDLIALGLKPGQALNTLTLQQVGGIVLWDDCRLQGASQRENAWSVDFNAWWQALEGMTKIPADLPAELLGTLRAGPKPQADEGKRRALFVHHGKTLANHGNPELQQARQQWLSARAELAAAKEDISGTLVFGDAPQPRPTFVALRGQYNKPGEQVQPGVPAILPALKRRENQPRATRLDLARWLIDPAHPLTARVSVNRFWQQVFGVGLVKTSHDFGAQGEAPSHPQLLDALAWQWMSQGWDVKELMRLLLGSRAFRQDSRVSAALLDLDPENRLLARGPRLRLDAEQIRDNALALSGLLNPSLGGRGVRPYQPPNIWEPVGYADSNTRYYLQDHGPALYRRSLYTFLKRTAPPPFMSNFDGPNREQSCTRRERSNTPLQALQLLNDVQFFEAARALAARTLGECSGNDEQRLQWMMRTVLCRRADAHELGLLREALAQQRRHYQRHPDDAEKTLSVGESTTTLALPATELAAWTLLGNLLLNLDETLNRN